MTATQHHCFYVHFEFLNGSCVYSCSVVIPTYINLFYLTLYLSQLASLITCKYLNEKKPITKLGHIQKFEKLTPLNLKLLPAQGELLLPQPLLCHGSFLQEAENLRVGLAAALAGPLGQGRR